MARLLFIFHALQVLTLICTSHAYTRISDDTLEALPRPGADFDIKNGKLLSPILRTRVPGTPGSTAVLNHFVNFFKNDLPQWTVSFQNSSSKTPVTGSKDIPFVNMIATRDPPWTNSGEVGYLTLVAHYDSKIDPEGFIGAIDSAAPCAMLMHVARSLDGALTTKWSAIDQMDVKQEGYEDGFEEHKGIKIIFLDGEEAFGGTWTKEDSIYGARALAAELEATYHPALSTYHNALSSISLFFLLDLLGSKNPYIPSYFKTTHWAYRNLAALEKRLRGNSKFRSSPNHPTKRTSSGISRQEPLWLHDVDKIDGRWLGGYIEDDHLPFMARGVEVLHLIPSDFPPVWHKIFDDGEHLDLDTCEDWAILVTAFAAEWMDLEGFFETKPGSKRSFENGGEIVSKTEL